MEDLQSFKRTFSPAEAVSNMIIKKKMHNTFSHVYFNYTFSQKIHSYYIKLGKIWFINYLHKTKNWNAKPIFNWVITIILYHTLYLIESYEKQLSKYYICKYLLVSKKKKSRLLPLWFRQASWTKLVWTSNSIYCLVFRNL